MPLTDVTDEGINRAMDECDELGREVFLKRHGFGRSRGYFVIRDGRRYDSKAIVGVAHGYDHPNLGPLESRRFSGGNLTVARHLEFLGFEVERPPPPSYPSRAKEGSPIPTLNLAESTYVQITEVEVEAQHVEQFRVSISGHDVAATRREQSLVLAYVDHLKNRGHTVKRHTYQLGHSHALVCDFVDETDQILYEAKGDVLRTSVRMAIGQLFDYRRFEPIPMRLAILLPCKPSQDIIELICSVPASAVWRTPIGFASVSPGAASAERVVDSDTSG